MHPQFHSSSPFKDDMHFRKAEYLALALYDQARGESVRAKEALAMVMMGSGRPWCAGAEARCGAKTTPGEQCGEFADDQRCAEPYIPQSEHASRLDSDELDICRRIVRRVMAGALDDPTRGANAYHTIFENPAWAAKTHPIASFGKFLFYRIPQ